MKCYVCGSDNWKWLEKIHAFSVIGVCKQCGNAAHKVDVAEEEKLKQFYRYEYRPAPNHINLLTTTNKRSYIARFLSDFLNEASKAERKMICGDVGCATGYIPAWLRSLGHKATGCELTVNYRRFAEAFYGIPVPEELEPKHKYDLITIYHVLEHLMEPDKKLEHYRSLMADDGRIMVSTPEWFDTLEEASGAPIGSFENLFHKNHINLFSSSSLKNIFSKVGLEIVKEDHIQYGQTYLLKKCEPGPLKFSESPDVVVGNLEKCKKAIDLHMAGKHEEALDVWPKFPEPWIALTHGTQAKDPEKQKDLFARALQVLPNNMRLLMAYGTWLYMREDLPGALAAYKTVEQNKPTDTVCIFMAYCYGKMGQFGEAAQAFYRASELNPTKWVECMDQICAMAVQRPAWDERAIMKLQKELTTEALKNGKRPELTDPMMEPMEATK